MIRRDFLRSIAAIGGALALPSCIAGRRADEAEFIHNSLELDTTILMKGLTEPFTLLHITDSHVSVEGDETEEPYLTWSAQMRDWNDADSHNHFKTHELISPLQCFERLMEMAKEKQPDLIVLTGDIINYPSEKCVNTVLKLLNDSGIKWIYTAGNHDWYYPDEPGTMEELRKKWIAARLMPLYQGRNPMYDSLLWKGLNIVLIDNSTNQVSEEQLDFYRRQAAMPQPVALFMHIPLFMQGMRRRNPEGHKENPTTSAFKEEVLKTPHLAGIFTGHWHEHRVVTLRNKVQYVTSQAADGRYKFVRFADI